MNLRRQPGRTCLLFRTLAGLIIGLCAISSQVQADDWTYTLRPGDDLWSIAQKFCGLNSAATKIAQHNGLSDPANVRAGIRINIPIELLVFEPATAQVVELSGTVKLARGTSRTVQQVPARAGDVLRMGNELVTKDGYALVEFADGSQIALAPHSRVLFNKLTQFGPAGMIDTHLRFTYGRARARVQPQNRGDRFRIATPGGIAAVRGTEFRVGHANSDNHPISTAETLEGRVNFEHASTSYDLPGGFGVSVSDAGAVREALLPGPSWLDSNATVSVGGSLHWQATPGAKAYVVSWLLPDSSRGIVAQRRTTDSSIDVDVATGDYVFAVRAVAESGIEGLDAERDVGVRDLAPLNLSVGSELSGEVSLAWSYPDPNTNFVLSMTSTNGTSTHSVVGLSTSLPLDAGAYAWQVKAPNSIISAPHNFTLSPPPPSELAVDVKRKTLNLTWSPSPEADASYEVIVATATNTQIHRVLTQTPNVSLDVTKFGKYRVTIRTISNDQQSTAVSQGITVHRQPWWLFGLAILLFI